MYYSSIRNERNRNKKTDAKGIQGLGVTNRRQGNGMGPIAE